MKKTFKRFLDESISVVDGAIQISTQKHKSGSTKDEISTYFNRKPYITAISGCDAKIYSILNYVPSEISTDMLKSLKGGGPYKVNDKQFESLMKQVRSATSTLVKSFKPDIIIYPKSKSPLLKQFVNEVASEYPSAEVLSDKFIKTILDAENVEPLINTSHPGWKKFAEENPKQVVLLKKDLKRQIKGGELELKKFYKPYLKFIKNFLELEDAYQVLEKVMGKNVIVVDDILSSGSTMTEMIRQLTDFEPSEMIGLTMFKLTSSLK